MDITERIINHLIMASSFTPNIGLYHGKTGIVIALCHYARFTGKTIYDDFAGELLDEVCSSIHAGMSADLENGLAGIGWGIEYLLQNRFMEGDSNVVLRNVNRYIMKQDIRRMEETSVKEGINGIYYYVDKHLQSPCRDQSISTFDHLYLQELYGRMENRNVPDGRELLLSIIGELPSGTDFLTWNIGLEKGCAGYILKNAGL